MFEGLLDTLTLIAPVIYTLAAGILLDVATGVWAAWKSGTLNPEFIPTFFTSNVLKRATPIVLGLGAGLLVAGSAPALAAPVIATSATAAAAYLWSLVGSIVANIEEGRASIKGVPTSVALGAAVTPVVPPASVDSVTEDVTEEAEAINKANP